MEEWNGFSYEPAGTAANLSEAQLWVNGIDPGTGTASKYVRLDAAPAAGMKRPADAGRRRPRSAGYGLRRWSRFLLDVHPRPHR
nr:hypothetical protein [Streptomyces zhihengii]